MGTGEGGSDWVTSPFEIENVTLIDQENIMSDGNVAADQLQLFIERIERIEEEIKGASDDRKDVYAEAKANGYDTKTMRKIVALRRLEAHVRQEADALLEMYRNALGLA